MQTLKPSLKLIFPPKVSIIQQGHTINPNNPITDAKISTINTLTNNVGSAASARAALLPTIPTLTPHAKSHSQTVSPAQNIAYPEK
jgi:hypothetical protein